MHKARVGSTPTADRQDQKNPPFAVDTNSHVGLRGVAALWVMLFHSFLYSDISIDLQGSTLMPLFFVLSGFSLMLGFNGGKPGTPADHIVSSGCCDDAAPSCEWGGYFRF
jgi:hypothetical protein